MNPATTKSLDNPSVHRPFLELVCCILVYGLILLAGGLYAYTQAPADANKVTAIAIPGGCAAAIFVLLVAMLLLRNGRVWPWIGIAAAVCALVFGFLFLGPLRGRLAALERVPAIQQEFDAAVASGATANTPEARREFFREPPSVVKSYEEAVAKGEAADSAVARKSFIFARNAPSGDITYLIRTLRWLMTFSFLGSFFIAAATFKCRLALRLATTAATPTK